MSPFDLIARSFGLFSRFPSYLSTSVTNLPPTSLATRRSPCWHRTSSPALLNASPLQPGSLPVNGAEPVYPLGFRNSFSPPAADHSQIMFRGMSENSRRLLALSQTGPSDHSNFFSARSSIASEASNPSRAG